MAYEPVFDFAVQTSPIFKLVLVGSVAGIFALVVILMSKVRVAAKALALIVPVGMLFVSVSEFAHTQPAYARIENGILHGVEETQGRFIISGPGAFTIGSHAFDTRARHHPALVLRPARMNELDGACVKARYTSEGDIVWLGRSASSSC